MAERSKAPDSSSGSRERACVQIPLLTLSPSNNYHIFFILLLKDNNFFSFTFKVVICDPLGLQSPCGINVQGSRFSMCLGKQNKKMCVCYCLRFHYCLYANCSTHWPRLRYCVSRIPTRFSRQQGDERKCCLGYFEANCPLVFLQSRQMALHTSSHFTTSP